MPGLRRWVENAAIVFILTLFLIDGTPRTCLGHQQLKADIDPILDVTGLWQGSWSLFAPNIDRNNTYISADITFADGSEIRWQSPDWRHLGLWDKHFTVRQVKLYDNLRRDNYSNIWPHFARYIGEEMRKQEGKRKVSKVVLTRYWWEIPPPDQMVTEDGRISLYRAPQSEYQSYVYFTKEYTEEGQ